MGKKQYNNMVSGKVMKIYIGKLSNGTEFYEKPTVPIVQRRYYTSLPKSTYRNILQVIKK